ncbi:MAG: hypothetical protein WCW35_04990 [Bacteroidota bacterium]
MSRTITVTEQQHFDNRTINAVWEKAQNEFGFYFFKRDHLGDIIAKHDYGKKSQYGWEIVRIVSDEQKSSEGVEQLLPVHWKNVPQGGG